MIKEKVIVRNKMGLHLRPISELVKLANRYKCKINIIYKGKKVNAKSVLDIMSAGIKANVEIEIECDGEEEKIAIEEITKAFANKLNE